MTRNDLPSRTAHLRTARALTDRSRARRPGRPRGRAARRSRAPGPALAGARDPEMERVARNIALHGLHLVHVGEGCDCADCTEPAAPPEERFGYTIGLTARGHPELLVRGLGAQETAELLNRWGRTVLAGDVFEEGDLLCEGPGGPTWELGPVYRQARTLAWATRYYGPDRLRLRPPLELRPSRQPCMCGRCD